jgi:hypothetical protein
MFNGSGSLTRIAPNRLGTSRKVQPSSAPLSVLRGTFIAHFSLLLRCRVSDLTSSIFSIALTTRLARPQRSARLRPALHRKSGGAPRQVPLA